MATLNETQPTTPNQLQGTKFLTEFRRFPNMQVWTQNFFIPGLTIGEAIQVNPFADIRRAGDKVTFDPVTITFIVDEYLQNWGEVATWMMAIGKAKNMRDRQQLINKSQPFAEGIYSDMSITILSASNNPRTTLVFRNAWPSSLSTFTMTSTDSAETTLTVDATFYYDYFDIVKENQINNFALA